MITMGCGMFQMLEIRRYELLLSCYTKQFLIYGIFSLNAIQTFQIWMNAFSKPPSYNGISYDTAATTQTPSFFGSGLPQSSYYQPFSQTQSSMLPQQQTQVQPTTQQPILPQQQQQPSQQQEQEQFDKDRVKAREQVTQKYRGSMHLPQRPCWYALIVITVIVVVIVKYYFQLLWRGISFGM